MLGDSVKRRQGGGKKPSSARGKKASGRHAAGRRVGWKFWLALLMALTLPFVFGYFIAVRVLFPPPPVVAEGIQVPRLLGDNLETAQRALVEAGLGALDVSELPSLSVAAGLVIAQSPLPGQQLRAGAPVSVAISSGPPRVFIPDVVGFPVERAASLLIRLGFEVQRSDTVSNADEGRVIEIDPEPGTQIRLPARVSILVSLGPPPDTTAIDTLGFPLPPGSGRGGGWSPAAGMPIFDKGQGITPHDDTRVNGRN